MLFCLGYWWITTIKKRIQDYDRDYPKQNSNRKPCIIVSNHLGMIEAQITTVKYAPAYISKDAGRKIPLVGGILEMQQTLFLKRHKKEDKIRVIKQITERMNLIEREETMPQLSIFPEGTLTNGKALL